MRAKASVSFQVNTRSSHAMLWKHTACKSRSVVRRWPSELLQLLLLFLIACCQPKAFLP